MQIGELIDLMNDRCQIKSFTLINVHHSEESFDKLCCYVKESHRLRELKLSWQYLQPSAFVKLLRVIRDNRTLVNLSLSWNKLLYEQRVTSEADIERAKQEGVPVEEIPLSKRNKEILDYLANFIKYNTYLIHLDLSNCGLIAPAIQYISSFLTKA